jgi:predicted SnoaL-like aldol condensation-catalyzing enzyme
MRDGKPTMTPEQNKKIALEAFEALFNRKDIEAARAFWSPDYMQHNPLFAAGARAFSSS